jgi:hypothetical protein
MRAKTFPESITYTARSQTHTANAAYQTMSSDDISTYSTKRKAPEDEESAPLQSSAAKTPSRPPEAAAQPKVSPDDEASAETPYSTFQKAIEGARVSKGDDYVIWELSDVLEQLGDERLEELGTSFDHLDDLSNDEREQICNKLTQSDIDKHLPVMIVPRSLLELLGKLQDDLTYADERNDRHSGFGFVMLNTYSTYCMYPVIDEQISAATRELNKAVKSVTTNSTPNAAAKAFKIVFATIMALNRMDHWRCDYEDEEQTEKIGKKVLKLAKDLLWFEDSELGFTEPYSRKGLVLKLEEIAKEWLGGADKLKVPKNGHGLGRSHAPAPKAKKAKLVAVPGAAAMSGSAQVGGSIVGLNGYLSSIDDKLSLRVKTILQLKIVDATKPNKSALVVLSGATDMKKMSQLCAYITGHSDHYQYHSQKGTSMKGSRIELTLGDTKTWLAEKSALKHANTAGATLCVDKNIKIVQVFQGLNTSPDSGIVFDSEEAKTFACTPQAVVWVAPNGSRYEIKVQAVAPQKCEPVRASPLPRLVTHTEDASRVKTGFGKGIYASNKLMKGDRQCPQLKVLGHMTQSDLEKLTSGIAARPICNEEGKEVFKRADYSKAWDPEDVASAGLPA